MLNNLTIKSRLTIVLSFLALLLTSIGGAGLYSLGATNDSLKTIYADRLVAMGQLDSIIRLLLQNKVSVAESIVAGSAGAEKSIEPIQKRIEEITRIWDMYAATYLTPEEKILADKFSEARKKFIADAVQPAVAAIHAKDFGLATEVMQGPMTQLFLPVLEHTNALIQLQLDVGNSEYEKSQSMYDSFRAWSIAAIALGLLIAAIMGIWLIRAITRPLLEAVTIARSVASGDLTQRIDVTSSNETGQMMQALKDMSDSLSRTVSQVRSGTDTIATASSQIAAGNMDLSSRTEQQASSLEETASSMEELTSTVRQNADNARQANQLAASASDVAVKGGAVVAQVVDTMSAIDASAKKIVDIISVIDGIAFQTNILALNAAVEAARAGEQGRGFAVVATEVRNLAQRSAAAAREIKLLIGDSVERVEMGSQLVSEAGATMDEIVSSVKRVTDIMCEITAASQEQSAGIEQINTAITQMDQVTQQNAALVEQAAAAAESLQDQAKNLAEVVSVFTLNGTIAIAGLPVAAKRDNTPPRKISSEPAANTAYRKSKKIAPVQQANGDDGSEF
ncbi:MAG: methyl-accepting chemotaxis protein [Oxalobacteraceae bacterium]